MRFFKKRVSTDNVTLPVASKTRSTRLITAVEPKNPVSEQFRTLRTNIAFAAVSKKDIKTLLISSALPSEGKSTVTTNLAIVYAQQGKKVLLVDADLRRPTVAATFGLNGNTTSGLTNYLVDNHQKISDVIQHTTLEYLDVVTSGPIPPNPAELLGSEKMRDLVNLLKEQYDLIIFDVPPLLIVADTQVLMSIVDGVVIVVNAGKTTKNSLRRTSEILKIAQAPVLGFIYNDSSHKEKKGYGYGYGYTN